MSSVVAALGMRGLYGTRLAVGGVGRAYPNYPMKAGDQGCPISGI